MLASLAIVLGLGLAPLRAADLIEQIVAKVNGDIITKTELDRDARGVQAEMAQRGIKGPDAQRMFAEVSKNLLRDKIDTLLLVQKGKELNVNVDNEVTRTFGEYQKRSKIADPDKFKEWVREQTGMSFEDMRNKMKENMIRQRVVGSEVSSKINLPKGEIEKYYEANKKDFIRQEQIFLRQIFILTEGKTEAEKAAAQKKAVDVVARARKGERFADLARENSDDESREEGGAMPPLKKEDLDPKLVELLWDKPRNHVTDPLDRGNGWLILRVDEHVKEGQATLEEAENEIRERLFQPLFEPKMREYLTQLREQAFLEIRDGFIDTAAAPGKDTRWQDPATIKPDTVTKEEVAEQTRRKRLLWMVPIPGTKTIAKGKSSSK